MSGWTRVGARRFHARTAAVPPPAGSPIVLLVHGLGVSSRYMIPTIRTLAPDHLVFAIDLPGYGRTPGPPHALSIPELADALLDWMTVMRIERPLLLGNSMGCQVLVDLAVRHPSRVERLVLVGPTMDRCARTGWQQFGRLIVDTFREAPSQPFLVAFDYAAFGLRRFRETFRDAVRDRIEDKLPHVTAPVLVVRGARDPIVPERWAREVAARAPRGRFAAVPDAAHTVNYMAPEALARLVREFLADPSYQGDRT